MNRLSSARRIVLKIGSAMVADERGRLRAGWLAGLAEDIADLRGGAKDVIVVSSGAIALGRAALGMTRGPLKLDEAQAAAAVGQITLAGAWRSALAEHGLTTAQILLTLDDTEQRRRYLNARTTVATLLSLGAVPIVNENDTVATSEIRYGDNDRLAARVASMASADCLVLLSDVDGFYTAAPDRVPDARHIPEVREITDEIAAMAEPSRRPHGTGGMITKLEAARIATQSGCHMAIALGREARPIQRLLEGARATWFVANASPVAARKQWIAASLKPAGTITIDTGAGRALMAGKSLLPAGVRRVAGRFERGDAVIVADETGAELARGLVAYSSAEAARIVGAKSGEIEAILGYRGRTALVHRDDLVITNG